MWFLLQVNIYFIISKSELHITQSIGYNNQKTNVIGPEFKTSEKSAGTGLDKPLISVSFYPKKKRKEKKRLPTL